MKRVWAFAILVTGALCGPSQPAQAAVEGPWCAYIGLGEDSMIEKCDMMSFEQCRAETMSMGGNHCAPNPRYHAAKNAETKRRKAGAQRSR